MVEEEEAALRRGLGVGGGGGAVEEEERVLAISARMARDAASSKVVAFWSMTWARYLGCRPSRNR